MTTTNNNKIKHVFDFKTNIYLDLTPEEFKVFWKKRCSEHLAYIFNSEQNKWLGYPPKIAFSIMVGDMTHEDYIKSLDTPNE